MEARELSPASRSVSAVILSDVSIRKALAEGRIIGVLNFSSLKAREPDQRLLAASRVIGSQIGQFLQRKSAEASLRESEARFRQTFELAASGICHVSEGRFVRVNRSLCEILGYPEKELLGKTVKEVSHPDDRDVTDAELTGRQYGFDTHSAIRLESKADMKKRGLSSPDNADALSLTFAYPVADLPDYADRPRRFGGSGLHQSDYDPVAEEYE